MSKSKGHILPLWIYNIKLGLPQFRNIRILSGRIVKQVLYSLSQGQTWLCLFLQLTRGARNREQRRHVDKAPRLSISIVIWILSSDTICQLNQFNTNSEAAMLSKPAPHGQRPQSSRAVANKGGVTIKPLYREMVVDAIISQKERVGSSLSAIKNHLSSKY